MYFLALIINSTSFCENSFHVRKDLQWFGETLLISDPVYQKRPCFVRQGLFPILGIFNLKEVQNRMEVRALWTKEEHAWYLKLKTVAVTRW